MICLVSRWVKIFKSICPLIVIRDNQIVNERGKEIPSVREKPHSFTNTVTNSNECETTKTNSAKLYDWLITSIWVNPGTEFFYQKSPLSFSVWMAYEFSYYMSSQNPITNDFVYNRNLTHILLYVSAQTGIYQIDWHFSQKVLVL